MKLTAVLFTSALALSVLMLSKSPIENAQARLISEPAAPLPLLVQLDRNADGKLSFLEAKQDSRLVKAFYSMDLDLDGFLSPAELNRLKG